MAHPPQNPTQPFERDEELGALLRARVVPEAGVDFWSSLEEQMDAHDGDTTIQRADGPVSTDSVEIIGLTSPVDELARRRNQRNTTRLIMAAAALVLVAGTFAVFRTISESSAPNNITIAPEETVPDEITPDETAPGESTPNEILATPAPSVDEVAVGSQTEAPWVDYGRPIQSNFVASGLLVGLADGPEPLAYVTLPAESSDKPKCFEDESGVRLDAIDVTTGARFPIDANDARIPSVVPGPFDQSALIFGCRNVTGSVQLLTGDPRVGGVITETIEPNTSQAGDVVGAEWIFSAAGDPQLILATATQDASGDFRREAVVADFATRQYEPVGAAFEIDGALDVVSTGGTGLAAVVLNPDGSTQFRTPEGVLVALPGVFNTVDYSPVERGFVISGDDGMVYVGPYGFISASYLDGPAWDATFTPSGDAVIYGTPAGLRARTNRNSDVLLDPNGTTPVGFTDNGLSLIYRGVPNDAEPNGTVHKLTFEPFEPEPSGPAQPADLLVPQVGDTLGGDITAQNGSIIQVRSDGTIDELISQFYSPEATSPVIEQHWLHDVTLIAGRPHLLATQFINDATVPAVTDFEVAILAFDLTTGERIEVERRRIDTIGSIEWMYNGHVTSQDGTTLVVERQLWQGACNWVEKLSFPSGERLAWPESPVPRPAIDGITDAEAAVLIETPLDIEGCVSLDGFDGVNLLGQSTDRVALEALTQAAFEQSQTS